MIKEIKKTKGNILLTAMLILSAMALIMAVGIALTAIDNLNITSDYFRGEQADYLAEGCLEDGLMKLSRNASYTGGTFSHDTGQCVVTISGAGLTKTIQVRGTLQNYVSEIQVNVNLTSQPYILSNWKKGF